MKKTLMGALIAATLLPAAAQAQDRPARPDPFARADANGDGTVSRDEMLVEATASFDRFDANKDGKLSTDERPARGMGRGEGELTREAALLQATNRFDRVDANKDGKLDKAELEAARAMMGRFRGGPGGQR